MSHVILGEVSSDVKDQVLKLDVLDALRDFIGSDPLRHYLSGFVENTAHNIQRIGMAIAAEDGQQIRHLAHNLKGTSANIGALKLAWQCVELEALSAKGGSHESLIAHYQQLERVFQDTQMAIESYIIGLATSQGSFA